MSSGFTIFVHIPVISVSSIVTFALRTSIHSWKYFPSDVFPVISLSLTITVQPLALIAVLLKLSIVMLSRVNVPLYHWPTHIGYIRKDTLLLPPNSEIFKFLIVISSLQPI